MRGLLVALGAACLVIFATGCASSTASEANIDQGEYSGVTALGQSIVIQVSGSQVRVNSAMADFPDATTNAQFTVGFAGTPETFDCANTDGLHTLTCTVTRDRVVRVNVPCNLLASPPPSASPSPATSATVASSPSAAASASPSATAQLPAVTTPQCAETLPRTETVTLLHLCTTAPCPENTTTQ